MSRAGPGAWRAGHGRSAAARTCSSPTQGFRGLVIRIHGGDVESLDAPRHPGRRRRHDQRAGAMDDEARARRPRGVGRHTRDGRRRDSRQRPLPRPADQRADRRRDARRARWRRDGRAGGGDGVRLRLQPAAPHRRGCACRPSFGVGRATRRRCGRRRAHRWRSASARSRSSPPSAGCIFQNPDPARDVVPDGIPPSAGALVDRAGLKGARTVRRGSRRRTAISSSTRAARRAADIRALIERVQAAGGRALGVALREEIVYLGFGGETARTA